MIYDQETDPHLKSWLVKNLEPICDAEPGALADYILALLKHSASEPDLRKELNAQLEEFLEKETVNFIDLLFNALRSKSFLPYTTSPSPTAPSAHPTRTHQNDEPSPMSDVGIPIPLDAVLPQQQSSSRKRSLERPHEEREYRKGPRLSNDSQFPRFGNSGRQWPASNRGTGRGRDPSNYGGDAVAIQGINDMNPMGSYVNGRSPQQQYRPPDQVKRGICRDYHNHGYCSRGAYCKFSHGEDAVVPSQLLPMTNMPTGMLPFMSMMNNAMFSGVNAGLGGNGVMVSNDGAYDPHERIDMRPRGGMMRTPMMHRQDGSITSSGELPVIQDLTPRAPIEEQRRDRSQNGYGTIGSDDALPTYSSMDVDVASISQPQQLSNHQHHQKSYNHHPNGGYRGRRGGRVTHAPGTFPTDDLPQADLPSTSSNPFPTSLPRPERRNDKTLVVEKIPEEHLSLGAVNDWFRRFGTVTNVAVDAQSAKALVSFSEHDDALKAWKSEDAVFGNRFVKVFWHRPMGGHGVIGAKMLKASAPLVTRLAAQDAGETNASNEATIPAPGATSTAAIDSSSGVTQSSVMSAKPASSNTVSALAAKQQLLEQQIAEQKALIGKLQSANSPEEKKEVRGKLRQLEEEMKVVSIASSSGSSTPGRRTASTAVIRRPEDQERIERERLDKELELHAASTSTNGEVEESTESLRAKLAKLKAEAASLGLSDGDSSYSVPSDGSYRPYRGRARPFRRGYYGGRRGSGVTRTSLKLDNRPRKLLLKGVDAEGLQTVKDWYGTTGSLELVESTDNGDLIVSFATRTAAEQGFAKGSNVPTVGQVQVSWYTDRPTTTTQRAEQPSIPPAGKHDVGAGRNRRGEHGSSAPASHDPHGLQEEEVVASGWGDDGEDGMGML